MYLHRTGCNKSLPDSMYKRNSAPDKAYAMYWADNRNNWYIPSVLSANGVYKADRHWYEEDSYRNTSFHPGLCHSIHYYKGKFPQAPHTWHLPSLPACASWTAYYQCWHKFRYVPYCSATDTDDRSSDALSECYPVHSTFHPVRCRHTKHRKLQSRTSFGWQYRSRY